MKRNVWIPAPLFKKILASVPVPTIDFVIVRKSKGKKEFLLGKRANKPFRGRWFIIGGHILWGETLDQAVKRQFKKELGFIPKNYQFLFIYSLINPPGNLGVPYNSILHIYQINLADKEKFHLNSENSELKWFSKIQKDFPKAVAEILKQSGL